MEDVLTVFKASQLCNVSAKTIINWIESGHIKAYKTVGGHRRIPATSLESLCSELTHHFDEEESGGCLEEAVSLSPSLAREAARLERQHAELLEAVARLIGRLRTPEANDSIERVEADFYRFVEDLQDHEAAEDRILAVGLGVHLD